MIRQSFIKNQDSAHRVSTPSNTTNVERVSTIEPHLSLSKRNDNTHATDLDDEHIEPHPMLAQWLRQSFEDGPYHAIANSYKENSRNEARLAHEASLCSGDIKSLRLTDVLGSKVGLSADKVPPDYGKRNSD